MFESNTVERGALLDVELGQTAIVLDRTYELRVRDNRFDISTVVANEARSVVDVTFGGYCAFDPTQVDSLVLKANVVLGPGVGLGSGERIGIRSDWVCGVPGSRDVLYEDNYVSGFRAAGMRFEQASDVQVNCNTVENCRRAVDVKRTAAATGTAVRFKDNWLSVLIGAFGAETELLRTDDAVRTRFGPSLPARGDNGLIVAQEFVNFINEIDPDTGDAIQAQNNYWYLDDNGTELLIPTVTEFPNPIGIRIVPTVAEVQYLGNYGTDAGATYCRFEGGAVGKSAPAQVQPSEAVDDGSRGEKVASDAPPPTSFMRVGTPRMGATTLNLGIAAGQEGLYRASVFNVAGKRVASILERALPAGVHVLEWSGRESDGSYAAAGVYFVRVTGPGLRQTQKVVVLR